MGKVSISCRRLTCFQTEQPPAQVPGKLHQLTNMTHTNVHTRQGGRKSSRASVSFETLLMKARTHTEVRTGDFLSGPVL